MDTPSNTPRLLLGSSSLSSSVSGQGSTFTQCTLPAQLGVAPGWKAGTDLQPDGKGGWMWDSQDLSHFPDNPAGKLGTCQPENYPQGLSF